MNLPVSQLLCIALPVVGNPVKCIAMRPGQLRVRVLY
jgi:hypothetical protein